MTLAAVTVEVTTMTWGACPIYFTDVGGLDLIGGRLRSENRNLCSLDQLNSRRHNAIVEISWFGEHG